MRAYGHSEEAPIPFELGPMDLWLGLWWAYRPVCLLTVHESLVCRCDASPSHCRYVWDSSIFVLCHPCVALALARSTHQAGLIPGPGSPKLHPLPISCGTRDGTSSSPRSSRTSYPVLCSTATSASTRKQVGLGMVIIDRGHPHLIGLGEAVSCDSK